MTTMEKVYLDAQAACGLKVGDYVKIIRVAFSGEVGWNEEWNDMKDRNVGKVGKIVNIASKGICVKFSDKYTALHYPYFVLEKVEKPQHQFKPFDKVLVRCIPTPDEWECNIFSHIIKIKDGDGRRFIAYKCIVGTYDECIPYEGNEHLLGTTGMPEE